MASNFSQFSFGALDEADQNSPDSQGNNNSPWRRPSTALNSLRLPPLNPNPERRPRFDFALPSFDDASFFDQTPPRIPNHNHFAGGDRAANTSPSPSLFVENNQETYQNYQPPPPHQQARRTERQLDSASISHFDSNFLDSELPSAGLDDPFDPFDSDPFDEFLNLTPTLTPPRSPTRRPIPSYNTTRSSSFVDLTEPSPTQNNFEMAPTTRKRKAPGSGTDTETGRTKPSNTENVGKVDVVNLVDVENESQYEEMKARKQAELIKAQNEAEANKPVKLAEFQCIICMDNPTDLTVTHCGHLFCSECLFQALHAGDKKCCPVCRTVINTGRPGGKTPKNGTFPLEMKLMTVKKKGKQPARD